MRGNGCRGNVESKLCFGGRNRRKPQCLHWKREMGHLGHLFCVLQVFLHSEGAHSLLGAEWEGARSKVAVGSERSGRALGAEWASARRGLEGPRGWT